MQATSAVPPASRVTCLPLDHPTHYPTADPTRQVDQPFTSSDKSRTTVTTCRDSRAKPALVGEQVVQPFTKVTISPLHHYTSPIDLLLPSNVGLTQNCLAWCSGPHSGLLLDQPSVSGRRHRHRYRHRHRHRHRRSRPTSGTASRAPPFVRGFPL